MSALDLLAQHDECMRGHYRAVARALVPDLDAIALEARYLDLAPEDQEAIYMASVAIERIASDGS